MPTTLRRIAALEATERRLLLEAAVVVLIVRVGLRALGFRSVRRALSRLATTVPAPRTPASVEAGYRAVRAATRVVPGRNTCLVRAVAASALLARHGHEASLRIGVERRGADGLDAHAWVELDGRTVLDGPDAGTFEGRLPPLELGRP